MRPFVLAIEHTIAMKPVDIAAALGTMLLWGLHIPIAKFGFADLPPLLFMSLRFAIAALVLCRSLRWPHGQIGGIFVMAVLLAANFGLLFSGVARMNAGTATILTQAQVPFAALLALVLHRDMLGWRRFIGMVIAFAGIIVIAKEPSFGRDPTPLILVLSSSFCWALVNVQICRIGPIDGLVLSAWLAAFGAPMLLLASLILEHGQLTAIEHASGLCWIALLYSGILNGIIAYQLWYPLIRRYPLNQVMPFNLLQPIFGVAGGVLILHERLSWLTAIGGGVTIIGVAIMILRFPINRPVPAETGT